MGYEPSPTPATYGALAICERAQKFGLIGRQLAVGHDEDSPVDLTARRQKVARTFNPAVKVDHVHLVRYQFDFFLTVVAFKR